MIYVVNLTTRQIDAARPSLAAAKAALAQLRTRDALTDDAYANRMIVEGLSEHRIETMLHSTPFDLDRFRVDGSSDD